MDEGRFDRLARSVGGGGTSRRSVLGGLVGGGFAALGRDFGAEGRKRCPNRKRCGKDCCAPFYCFAKRSEILNVPIGKACCPRENLCQREGFDDQCCYDDDTCDPRLPNSVEPTNLCCRSCRDADGKRICCRSFEECKNDRCVPLETARLPRRRA